MLWSFDFMGSLILEYKRKDLTTENVFGGSISRKLIALDIFFNMSSSDLVLEKVHIFRNAKPYPWKLKIFNYFRPPSLLNFNSSSIRCQTAWIAHFLMFLRIFSDLISNLFNIFVLTKNRCPQELKIFTYLDFNEWAFHKK